jgi:hypothetical protein
VYREAKWWPVGVVVLVIAFVTGGGYALAAVTEPVTGAFVGALQGDTVVVTDRVSYTIQPGWQLVDQLEEPPSVLISNGAAALETIVQGTDDPEALIEFYLQNLAQQATQLAVSETVEQVSLPSGPTGLRIAFLAQIPDLGVPIEGEISAFTSGGTGVLFSGYAPQGDYFGQKEGIDAMIATGVIT